jgi:enamine deaminase RidA (YjgF/YER057c/UK114 family)
MGHGRKMPKEIIATDNAPKVSANSSQAVKAGGFVFVAGQGSLIPGQTIFAGVQFRNKRGVSKISRPFSKPRIAHWTR